MKLTREYCIARAEAYDSASLYLRTRIRSSTNDVQITQDLEVSNELHLRAARWRERALRSGI